MLTNIIVSIIVFGLICFLLYFLRLIVQGYLTILREDGKYINNVREQGWMWLVVNNQKIILTCNHTDITGLCGKCRLFLDGEMGLLSILSNGDDGEKYVIFRAPLTFENLPYDVQKMVVSEISHIFSIPTQKEPPFQFHTHLGEEL